MLQKLSKCEVKAAGYGNFSNLLQLRFYVKSNFGELKWSKNVIFANFGDSELWNLVNCSWKIVKSTKNHNSGPLKLA